MLLEAPAERRPVALSRGRPPVSWRCQLYTRSEASKAPREESADALASVEASPACACHPQRRGIGLEQTRRLVTPRELLADSFPADGAHALTSLRVVDQRDDQLRQFARVVLRRIRSGFTGRLPTLDQVDEQLEALKDYLPGP